MGKFKYTKDEKDINMVLLHQDKQLNQISFSPHQLDKSIAESENLLKSIGLTNNIWDSNTCRSAKSPSSITIPSWSQLCDEAQQSVNSEQDLCSLFTSEELAANEEYITKLNRDFNTIHKLDKVDISICAIAGIVAGAIDILLIGIPARAPGGLNAGCLSNHIRKYFESKYPPAEMEKLGRTKAYKVPYDAQDNRNTQTRIEGLSAYYHRLLSLGHDPILGFLVGLFDILKGRMTTIDKNGDFVSQVMDNYADRKETAIFQAIVKQIRHLKSDLTTSMGLPAPLMSLFNFLQIGKIGEEEQTIAEIVQGMYYEGYDFIHFCSMSIPVMILEVIVRIGYCIKRLKEGFPLKDSIPVSLNRETHPKLATMLFIAHSASVAINAGKVAFTQNPLSINYPQWLAFAKYSFSQLKWGLYKKNNLRYIYVTEILDREMADILNSIDRDFNSFASDYTITFS